LPLTRFFMNKVGKRFDKKLAVPSPKLLALFEDFPWTGNVRQLGERIEALEITSITEALRRTRGNKVQASKLLGIARQGLDKKIQSYKIAGPSESSAR
jgi:DNA-binding NtrC family response regulator